MAKLFNNVLKDNESLFLNSVALDFEYQPKLVPYRENHQKFTASCIKPLFQARSGKNVLIFGPSGVGKTVSTKHVFNELEEYGEIIPIYINCWKKDTGFKMINEICNLIGYKWVHNKKTEELFNDVSKILNKKDVVFCFDEADKIKEYDLIYSIIEDIYRKSLLFITNDKNWVNSLDTRIKSRLMLENLEFEPYKLNEVEGILKQRMEFAFVKDSFDKESFQFVVKETFNKKDIRYGLGLMKNSAEIAENEDCRKVTLSHVENARLRINNNEELNKDEKEILKLIKENPMKSVMDLFKLYKENIEDISSRTFYRKISNLKNKELINVEGSEQGYSKVTLNDQNKKLDEF